MIEDRLGYDLDRIMEGIRPAYSFDVSCQGSVPESTIAFHDSEGYETAVRYAISLGGDATQWRALPAAASMIRNTGGMYIRGGEFEGTSH